MRKRRSLGKIVCALLVLLLWTAAISAAYFGIKGWNMYRDACSGTAVTDKVDEIRGGEHFVRYEDLPEFYINAVMAVEDHRFREHGGIDLIAIGRAAWTDIRSLSFREGGSTITQQVAKNLFFTQDKTFERKVAEVFAAFDLEKKYEKKEIFELYVNTVYFGSGCYGIYAAAEEYFKKEPSGLSNYEAALLAGVPNAPSLYGSDLTGEYARGRAEQVLRSMVREGYLTQEAADAILP